MTLLTAKLGAWAAALVLSAGPVKPSRAETLKLQAEQLAQAAQKLAHAEGCQKAGECQVAGFGHKSCGGPREYIAFCSLTTDVKALRAKLAELEKAEQAWQQEAHIMSTCSLSRRPLPQLVDGSCRAR